MSPAERAEWLLCAESPLYFLDRHCQVYDATTRAWLPFALWPAQAGVVRTLQARRLAIILKARQLGMTWLLLGWALWQMLFRPAATVLLFSRRDEESIHLLDFRLKGMYRRLPAGLRAGAEVIDAKHEWRLSNGSMALAFPTTGGDSYTATLAIVDEADLVPNLGRLLGAVKPTIDAGGQLVLLSRVDKAKPESDFKQIYRAAKAGLSDWAPIFLPWSARPGRDAAWYAEQLRDAQARLALDDLHEQYPATDTEALAPLARNKRIAGEWLERNRTDVPAITPAGAPAIPGLVLYRAPAPGEKCVIGADPAEGNPSSDDSAATVLSASAPRADELGRLRGKFEPAVFGAHLDRIGQYFNRAGVMCERNNHGHAVLLWLRDNSKLERLLGHDGKEGWLSNSKGKTLLYDRAAEAFRDDMTELHSFDTFTQLASIEGATLLAPEGLPDDLADSYALALVGATARRPEVRIR